MNSIRFNRERVDIELGILKTIESHLPLVLKMNKAYLEAHEDKTLPLLATISHRILVENKSQFASRFQEIVKAMPSLGDNPSEESIGKLIRGIKKKMIKAIYTDLIGAKILKTGFSFSTTDLNRAKVNLLSFFSNSTIDCSCFAFYHQHDFVALRNIFKDGAIDSEYLKSHYINVQEPKPGDLVVYAGGVHYGVWKGDGKVISKGGEGPIMEHTLEGLPLSYGETVLFFRKDESRLPFTREILAYLDDTEHLKIKHPLLRSPLTAAGSRRVFLEFLKACQQEQKEKLFTDSFYGVRTVEPLYRAIGMATLALQISETLSKRQLIIDT